MPKITSHCHRIARLQKKRSQAQLFLLLNTNKYVTTQPLQIAYFSQNARNSIFNQLIFWYQPIKFYTFRWAWLLLLLFFAGYLFIVFLFCERKSVIMNMEIVHLWVQCMLFGINANFSSLFHPFLAKKETYISFYIEFHFLSMHFHITTKNRQISEPTLLLLLLCYGIIWILATLPNKRDKT